MYFTVAERRPDQDRPDPCQGKHDLAGDFGRVHKAGDDESARDGVPPPTLSLEEQFQFGEQNVEEAEAVGGCGEWSQVNGC